MSSELLKIRENELESICQPEEALHNVSQFVENHIEGFLVDKRGMRPDIAKATLAVPTNARNSFSSAMTALTVPGVEGR